MTHRGFWTCGLLVITFGMLMTGAQTASAIQYSPPWAHVISFNDPSYVVDTTKIRWGSGWLESAGYDTYDPINLSTYSAYTYWLEADSVYIYCGHGGPGVLSFPQGTILAEDTRFPTRPNLDPIYLLENATPASQLGDNLLAMLIGCETAGTSWMYGNLLDMARVKGTDCAIGWPSHVYVDGAPVFGMGFMRGVLYEDYVIDSPPGWHEDDEDLMAYAYGYMLYQAESPDFNRKNWVVKGQYAQALRPARYGSW